MSHHVVLLILSPSCHGVPFFPPTYVSLHFSLLLHNNLFILFPPFTSSIISSPSSYLFLLSLFLHLSSTCSVSSSTHIHLSFFVSSLKKLFVIFFTSVHFFRSSVILTLPLLFCFGISIKTTVTNIWSTLSTVFVCMCVLSHCSCCLGSTCTTSQPRPEK